MTENDALYQENFPSTSARFFLIKLEIGLHAFVSVQFQQNQIFSIFLESDFFYFSDVLQECAWRSF